MKVPRLPDRQSEPCPETYRRFIAAARRFVEEKGIEWEIQLDADGTPIPGRDWDLRKLTGSHARTATGINGFAVISEITEACKERDWNPASLPAGPVLGVEVREFIQAAVAFRCKRKHGERRTRHYARILRKLFSSTNKMPWELSSEDLVRFLELDHEDGAVARAAQWIAKTANENLLSIACPLSVAKPEPVAPKLAKSISERKHQEKLPEQDALFELTRIVFQERPRSHMDLIRFSVVRLLILTGLRINEILMLPADCLRWEDHVDVVTGLPAGEIGGISRSLWLRYFGEKRDEGAPDVLVEDKQPVPDRFQAAVAEAVEVVLTATSVLRSTLKAQIRAGADVANSDYRVFNTTAGQKLDAADLLFLVLFSDRNPLPPDIRPDASIAPISLAAVYAGLGILSRAKGGTLFSRYGSPGFDPKTKLKPHSLRHLMNTELFRLKVADTVITNHFGRSSVAQTHEYDRQSLGERLAFVRLPEAAVKMLTVGSDAELVAKMVVGGMIGESHVAKSFKRIQREHGDDAAFAYLVSSADGFHITPYGFCINSFSLNPCARHLKCFDECKHFAASGLPEHKVSLEQLRGKMAAARTTAMSKPAKTLGRSNQIAHATKLLAGIEAALTANAGELVFPNGSDHSASHKDLFS
ncbi:MAG: hypothetical protein ACK50K_04330 [Betaproteobacteria bacterium]|jgi:integrase|nr:hypothetical protein [Rubrivivax sp.]